MGLYGMFTTVLHHSTMAAMGLACPECRGNIRTVMITGDYQHTAIAVAQDVNMLRSPEPIMVITTRKSLPAPMLAWHTGTDLAAANIGVSSQNEPKVQLLQQHSLGSLAQAGVQGLGQGRGQVQRDGQGQGGGQPKGLGLAEGLPTAGLQMAGQASASPRKHGWMAPQPAQSVSAQPQPSSALKEFSNRNTTQCDGSSGASKPVKELISQQLKGHSSSALLHKAHAQDSVTPAHAANEDTSLCFMVGNQQWDVQRALTALAEGRMRCALTGDALQLLLQLPDESALHAVLHSAVVYARMKPHQKGQVMDLLGTQGLYQLHGTQLRHIQVRQQCLCCRYSLCDCKQRA